MWLWVIALLGVLLAFAALASARRLSRRLDALTQSYWELRYDYTRLRAQIERLDPAPDEPDAAVPQASSSPTVSFVPLSTIRKRDN